MSVSVLTCPRFASWLRSAALVAALLGGAVVRADTTGSAGSSLPFNNTQPTTALTWMICTSGYFPTRDGDVAMEEGTIGEIRLLAYDGSSNTQGWTPCNGQTLTIQQNQALFSLLGTKFGGDGTTTFKLPDLRGRVPIGAGQGSGLTLRTVGDQGGTETTTLTTSNIPSHVHSFAGGTTATAGGGAPATNLQPYLVLNFCIQYGGSWEFMGWVRIFAFNRAPSGTIACDGSERAIQQYQLLYSKIGTVFGGDGVTTFVVPDLQGRTPIGEGTVGGKTYTLGGVGGAETIQLTTSTMPAHTHSYTGGTTGSTGGGQAHDTMQPYLVVNPLLSFSGDYQSLSGASGGLGEIRLVATDATAPNGWSTSAGQSASVAQNQALFSLLGTTFGGDGQATFGLPQLAGHAMAHFGSASGLTARAMGDAWGTTTVTLTTGNLAAHVHTYVAPPAPTVTSLSPTSGTTAGGATVTIAGTNLSNATAVKFGATNAASFTVDSATQITATAPAHAAGTVDITVTSAGGTSATSAADQFTYVAAPTVTSVSPTAGTTSGGTTVTITGTNFASATAVKFGPNSATSFTVNSATQITATAPANSSGTVDVTVTSVGGTSATSAADQFTYVAAPTVTSVSPTAGTTSGGATVTITGTNFASATAVKFGPNSATSFTVNSGTQITATAPANASGTVDVTVTSAGGTSATSAADQFTYVAAPTVTSVSPTTGTMSGGTTVTITGTNFASATAVKFGPNSATSFTVNSATQITATAPANSSGTVDVTVTSAGGTSATSAADQFTYAVPDTTAPTVVSVTRKTPSAQATNSSSVTFTVTYSEAVTNVSTSSFVVQAVNGSNIVGSVTSVSGSGSTRDVTVSITSGSGEFTLKVVQ